MRRDTLLTVLVSGLFLFLLPVFAGAAQEVAIPTLQIGVGATNEPGQVSIAIQVLLLLTVLALAPSILILMTSFTRLVIVFHFLRQAVGTQTMPPNQVLVGLSLFLTFFIMYPVFNRINEDAFQPYVAQTIGQEEAFNRALAPLREFMFKQTHEDDLAMFISMAKIERPQTFADIPTHVLIPSFIISELKTAFQIGFLIYIPFLMLDMVVASVLLSMGMMMLPPVMISLPFKLILFVMADGWRLMVGSLMQSF
ncbi:MAG: flagellar type III secretion system pore protein FliP [Deltaproteobacteria bacterium]|nr:flagellar type III secretion system pore protein FliP [Candidatus Tharpella sp.]